jgi:DNA helicase-2/ATP-dependent DNA helicase PcrA
MGLPSYLEVLNEKQKEAVLHIGSPLLILAGAGSGKTRVITTKIAYLIDSLGVEPESILAVTFTNKAAAEMRNRASALCGEASRVLIKTFHAFGAWLLRRNGHLLGLSSGFAIYDDEDSVSLLKSIYGDEKKKDLSLYASRIARAKDYCLSPDDDLSRITVSRDFKAVYEAYEKKLDSVGNVDFGDLILKPLRLLRSNPELRSRLSSRFSVILVDEYQDSNVAQYELLKALSGEHTYICVVGDEDQSIYRFRGAEVRNIVSSPECFPGTKIVRLEQNYRSTEPILRVAGDVIANNKGRLGKTLWTDKAGGEKPVLVYLPDQKAEAEFCARLLDDGNLDETAILYRTNAQSLPFETCFSQAGIPYRIVGSLKFYEREEVKDALALLFFLSNPRDVVSFKRIINKPARGIGEASVSGIVQDADISGGDLAAACRRAAASGRARKGIADFLSFFDKITESLDQVPVKDFVDMAIRASGLYEYHRAKDETSGSQKVGNLGQIVNAAAAYGIGGEALALFLEDLMLDSSRMAENDEKAGGVTLITMHNTKGLEFDRVIITGLENGLFPSLKSGFDPEDIEEERRIFYVSLTRAKKELYLTSCRTRFLWGRMVYNEPSMFLDEVPENWISVRRAAFGEGSFSEDSFPEGGGEGRSVHPKGFKPGSRVYHRDYGAGFIFKEWYNGDRQLVLVRFDTGKTAQFIPQYSSLERIADDD